MCPTASDGRVSPHTRKPDQEPPGGPASLRFDVNLSAVFADLPVLDRPEAAAGAGFGAVEFWWPFPKPTPRAAEQRRLAEALEAAGTSLVACNVFEGDLAAGDRGILSRPGADGLLEDSLAAALDLGRATGCRTFNLLYGNQDPGMTSQQQRELVTERLASAAQAAAQIGATLVLEVLNPVDNPGYALTSFREALEIISTAGAATGNVRLLVDLYHAAALGLDADAVLTLAAGCIGHVQIADFPGRHQPGTGSLGGPGLLDPLQRAHYDGWVGIEYVPLGPASASFGWLTEWRACS